MISNAQDIFEFTGIEQAADKQHRLSALITTETDAEFSPTLICGLDAAYAKDTAVAVAVVWDPLNQKIVEVAEHHDKVSMDYQPEFFGFREGKLLVGAALRLKSTPDVFLIDGHGLAHPRRLGLACHVGLALDKPSIGVAKSLLYGSIKGENVIEPNGAIVGKLLTREKGKSSYASIGHKISLNKAVEIVESCAVDNYPVPLRIAHSKAVSLREGHRN